MVIFLILVAIFIVLSCISVSKDHKKKIEGYEKQGLKYIEFYVNVNHYGGFKESGFIEGGSAYLFEDRVRLYGDDIFIKDIEDCRIKTETQLVSAVSAGRVIAFGALGLASKKKEEINKDYVIIKCEFRGEKTEFILSFKDKNGDFVTRVNKLIKQYNYNDVKKKDNDEELANSILYNYGEE
ncbi:hypothetical protein [Clostridium sardiniense]|uniref:hypothetical protein n=1 Tax=Clostridium sardiniense TaxID=29369 RepID=UPI001956A6CD|nr:hypothetical protein [Clostridium sardiniense]MBM7835726.1 hypothetical protein [Clostridium sardiniense]